MNCLTQCLAWFLSLFRSQGRSEQRTVDNAKRVETQTAMTEAAKATDNKIQTSIDAAEKGDF